MYLYTTNSIISAPSIGLSAVFDTVRTPKIHFFFVMSFFVTSGLYLVFMTNIYMILLRYENEMTLGDCIIDGTQNILDVVFIINNCILGGNVGCECGDLNQDNLVNILDIVLLANTILEI